MLILGLNTLTFIATILSIGLLILWVNLFDEREETEGKGFLATATVLAFVFFMYKMEPEISISFIQYIQNNVWRTVFDILLYFFVGTLWSFSKWIIFLKQLKISRIKTWGKKDEKPLVKDKLSTVTMWIVFWPFSVSWTLIENPVFGFAKFIVYKLEFLYDRISNNVWND